MSSAAMMRYKSFDTRGFFFISVNYRLCNLGIKEQRVTKLAIPCAPASAETG